MKKYDLEKDKDFFEETNKAMKLLFSGETLSEKNDLVRKELKEYFSMLYREGKICDIQKLPNYKKIDYYKDVFPVVEQSPLIYDKNGTRIKGINYTDYLPRPIENYFEYKPVGIHNIFCVPARDVVKFVDYLVLNIAKAYKDFIKANKLAELKNKERDFIKEKMNSMFDICEFTNCLDPLFLLSPHAVTSKAKKYENWYSQLNPFQKVVASMTSGDCDVAFFGEQEIEINLCIKINESTEMNHYIYAENLEKFDEKLLKLRKFVDDTKSNYDNYFN